MMEILMETQKLRGTMMEILMGIMMLMEIMMLMGIMKVILKVILKLMGIVIDFRLGIYLEI